MEDRSLKNDLERRRGIKSSSHKWIQGSDESNSSLPRVGIILVNYKGFGDTLECIASLSRLEYENRCIYLVDNASPDGSGERLEAELEKGENAELVGVELILLEKNLGFAGGNNVAIRHALEDGADMIWLLNNDTVVRPDSLSSLVQSMGVYPEAGICGSKIYFYNSSRLWYAGGNINVWGSCSHRGDSELDDDGSRYSIRDEVGYMTGCSMLIRREVCEEIGLLDEQFFLYYEDVEYCMRARRLGWKAIYDPSSIIWHKVSASSNSQYRDHAPIVDYYDTRNRILFVRKCYFSYRKILPWMGIVYAFFKKHIRIAVRPETNKINKLIHMYLGFRHGVIGRFGALTR